MLVTRMWVAMMFTTYLCGVSVVLCLIIGGRARALGGQ